MTRIDAAGNVHERSGRFGVKAHSGPAPILPPLSEIDAHYTEHHDFYAPRPYGEAPPASSAPSRAGVFIPDDVEPPF